MREAERGIGENAQNKARLSDARVADAPREGSNDDGKRDSARSAGDRDEQTGLLGAGADRLFYEEREGREEVRHRKDEEEVLHD